MAHLALFATGLAPVVHLGFELYERVQIGRLGETTVADVTQKIAAFKTLATGEMLCAVLGGIQAVFFFCIMRTFQLSVAILGSAISLAYGGLSYLMGRLNCARITELKIKCCEILVQNAETGWNQLKYKHLQKFNDLLVFTLEDLSPDGPFMKELNNFRQSLDHDQRESQPILCSVKINDTNHSERKVSLRDPFSPLSIQCGIVQMQFNHLRKCLEQKKDSSDALKALTSVIQSFEAGIQKAKSHQPTFPDPI